MRSIRVAVAARVREAREAKFMSQSELGVAMGYTAANPVSKLERAQLAVLDIGRLAAAARILDVDLEWLIEPATKASRGRASRRR